MNAAHAEVTLGAAEALLRAHDAPPPSVPAGEAARIWREVASGRCRILVAADAAGARQVLVVLAERAPRPDWGSLTARETEVLGLAAGGVSQKAIGIDLALAPSTVSQVLRRVRERWGFPSLAAMYRAYGARAVAHLAR